MSRQNQIASVRVVGVDDPQTADMIFNVMHAEISRFFQTAHTQHVMSGRGHTHMHRRVNGAVLRYVNDANQPLVLVTPTAPDPDPVEPRPLGKVQFSPPRTCYRQHYTIARAIGNQRSLLLPYNWPGNAAARFFLRFSSTWSSPTSAAWDNTIAEFAAGLQSGPGFSEHLVGWRNNDRGAIWIIRRTDLSWSWSQDQGDETYHQQLQVVVPPGVHTAILSLDQTTARDTDVPAFQDTVPFNHVNFNQQFATPEARIQAAFVLGELEVFECATPGTPILIREDGSIVLPGDPDYDLIMTTTPPGGGSGGGPGGPMT